MTEPVIAVEGLRKSYGSVLAVRGVDLDVAKGEVFGLLGPNGAGKTTILECLEGLRRADAGRLRVAGCDPQAEEGRLRRRLGVQLQSGTLPGSLRVREALGLVCAWHGVAQRPELYDRLGLTNLLQRRFSQLSTGERRRVELALALVHDPEVIALDEPTAGLDVESRARLHAEVRSLSAAGVTVLLATHDMAEAEKLCDRIAIVIGGKIAFCGTPDAVSAAGSSETRIRLRTRLGRLPAADVGLARLMRVKGDYREWTCTDAAAAVTDILRVVQMEHDVVEDLRVELPTLEERFLELVKEAERA
jgi:ABC-2 type transport system ATP-binding protein